MALACTAFSRRHKYSNIFTRLDFPNAPANRCIPQFLVAMECSMGFVYMVLSQDALSTTLPASPPIPTVGQPSPYSKPPVKETATVTNDNNKNLFPVGVITLPNNPPSQSEDSYQFGSPGKVPHKSPSKVPSSHTPDTAPCAPFDDSSFWNGSWRDKTTIGYDSDADDKGIFDDVSIFNLTKDFHEEPERRKEVAAHVYDVLDDYLLNLNDDRDIPIHDDDADPAMQALLRIDTEEELPYDVKAVHSFVVSKGLGHLRRDHC